MGLLGKSTTPGRLIDLDCVVEGRAIWRDGDAQIIRSEQAKERLGDEVGLKEEADVAAGRLLVHGVEEVAVTAVADIERGPERLVD